MWPDSKIIVKSKEVLARIDREAKGLATMFGGVKKGEIVAIENEVKTTRNCLLSLVPTCCPLPVVPELLSCPIEYPCCVGIIVRYKRWAFYAEKGEVKVVNVSEYKGDPAGDGYPEITLPATMIKAITQA